jgi:hypothetical protein
MYTHNICMTGCCCSAAQRRGHSLVRDVNQVLRNIAIALGVLAVVSGVLLLIKDAGVNIFPGLPTSMISATPLLLVAIAFLIAQPTMRPSGMELLKNILLAATFLLWGVVQLMPQGALSARLGNVVILLYVVDLAWVILLAKPDRSRQGFD